MRDPSYEIAKALYALLNESASILGSPKAFSTIPNSFSGNYIYIGGIQQSADIVKDKYVGDVSFDIWVVTPDEQASASRSDLWKITDDVLSVLKPLSTSVLGLGDGFGMNGLFLDNMTEDDNLTEQGRTYRKVLSMGAYVSAGGILVDEFSNILVNSGNTLISF